MLQRLLVYIKYESSHPIFRWIRHMEGEANALEGQMHALKVLLEVRSEFSIWSSLNDWKGRIGMEKE